MRRRSEREGWRVLEVEHLPGTTVSTCRVAAHRQAIDVGSTVRRADAVFHVEQILHDGMSVDSLEAQMQGQMVLSGPDAESLKVDDLLVLAIPCPVCGAVELTSLPYENWTQGPVLVAPPYEDHYGLPSYEVCPSCGYEFGNDDNPGTAEPSSFDAYRDEWVSQGSPRFQPIPVGDR